MVDCGLGVSRVRQPQIELGQLWDTHQDARQRGETAVDSPSHKRADSGAIHGYDRLLLRLSVIPYGVFCRGGGACL